MIQSIDRQTLAKKFFADIYNANHIETAQRLATALLADDFVDHSPQFGASADKAGFVKTVGFVNSVFEQHYHVEKLIIEDGFCTGIWKADVKHIGHFMGVPPTEKEFVVRGITIYEIAADKIVAHWEHFDIPAILQNLGILKA